jgi:4-aminobutyrate aminotransferase
VRFIQDVTLQRLVPPEDVAAILVEPIQGEGGYVVPPPRFFPALRELCDKHGILLIVDEVQSGMGRTGTLWAIEQWGVEPDMVCSAKGIASGLPLGALITRASIMNWPKGAHGNTFGGNPVACAAGLVTLELIQGGMMENAKKVGDFTLDALAEIQARHPSIGDVRGMGLMIGVEFVESRESKAPAAKLRDRVLKHAFARGVLMLGCGQSAIRISPALNIEQSLMEEALVTFEEAISEAEGENHRNVA